MTDTNTTDLTTLGDMYGTEVCGECGTPWPCTEAPDPTVLDFRPGDEVVCDAWGHMVFDVVGYDHTDAKGDLVKVASPDGNLTGSVPPADLRKVQVQS